MSNYIKVKGVSVLVNIVGAVSVSWRRDYSLDDNQVSHRVVVVMADGGSLLVVDDIELAEDAENIANSIIDTLKGIRTQAA